MDLLQSIAETLLPLLKPVIVSLLPVVDQVAELVMQLFH